MREPGTPLGRRTFLRLAAAATAPVALSGTLSGPAFAADPLPIVEDGVATAVVVAPMGDIRKEIDAALSTLTTMYNKVTQAILPIVDETSIPAGTKTVLYVGLIGSGSGPGIPALLTGLDGDGFVMEPYNNTITIIGPTPTGTQNGVLEFLERYLNVRWLMPTMGGIDGVDAPLNKNIAIPAIRVREEPSYLMRFLSPYPAELGATDARKIWAAANRLHFRYNIVTAMWSLFPPDPLDPADKSGSRDNYWSDHPEFYPLINGVHTKPTTKTGWQPRFTVPALVTEAVNNIVKKLDYYKWTSYSLVVNDVGGFSPDEIDTTKVNSQGFYDMSDVYYTWVNAVAAGVEALRPGKRCIVLAYREVYTPPSFPVHPNVIVFTCHERTAWLDSIGAAADQANLQAWKDTGATVGIYDYSYASPYGIPRVFFQTIKGAYKWAHDLGIRHHYSETGLHWGEGPKMWVYAKLLWNINADTDALLVEWCERAVGSAAAPYLAAYFRTWGRIWTTKVVHHGWHIANRDDVYYQFYTSDYLEPIDDNDLTLARTYIETAVEKAGSGQQKNRAELLHKAFTYYDATIASYPRQVPSPVDSAAALALLNSATAGVDQALANVAMRSTTLDEFATNPLLDFPLDPRNYAGNKWSGWNYYPLWTLADYIRVNEPTVGPVRTRAQEIATLSASANARRYASLLLSAVNNPPIHLGTNTSFENATLSPWTTLSTTPPREPMATSTLVARTGSKSLRVPGGYRAGSVTQSVLPPAGATAPYPFRFSIWYRVAPGTSATGGVYPSIITFQPNGSGGEIQTERRGPMRAASAASSSWTQVTFTEQIPANTTRIRCSLNFVLLGKQTTLFVDDAEFTLIDEP